MAYKLLYGGQYLHDPYTGESVTDASLTAQTNNADYLDFTIHYGHSLYDAVEENASIVELYWDKTKLFEGVIESIETDIEGSKAISCKGGLSYLEDTIVRAYSTVEGEQPVTAPSSPAGLFQWYIDQHNRFCDSKKRFNVGENQANMLDSNAYIYRSSSQNPTTWSEISSKLIDELGGYVEVQYTDPRTINYYADVHTTNAQIIDFGVNITDFSKTVDTADQYTAIYAQGATPDAEGDETTYPIDLTSLPDGTTDYSSDFCKDGDHVYSVSGVARYGYREYAYSNTDCTTAEGLLTSACKALSNLLSPDLSITVKAVDLALYMDGYDHLRAGQAVRVRSRFHDVDEYLMVSSISLDLNDPSQTTYELGASYQTLTGQQSSYLKNLNSNIVKNLDATSALSAETKAAAQDAKDAREEAATASATAETASSDASEAKEAASKAVVSTTTEYATNGDPTTAPTEGWSQEQPEWTAGNYIWMRQSVTYGDASTETTEPACITGNQGEQGADADIEAAEAATKAANTAAGKADTATTAANTAAAAASKVNATVDGTTLTVTDNTGKKTSVDTKGAKGEPGTDGAGFAWNLWTRTQDFYDDGTWCNLSSWTKESETYNGLAVISRAAAWGGIGKTAALEVATYTLSFYGKAASEQWVYVMATTMDGKTARYYKGATLTTDWQRYSVTFTPTEAVKNLRVECAAATKVYICGLKLEKGTTASPWCTTQAETIGIDGASVTSVKMEYARGDSDTTAPTSGWQDAVPDWETGKYIWQRSVTTIKATDGTTTAQTGDAVLYGVMNSLATDVEGNTSRITQTADALGVEFSDSGATSTLIRETSEGIEVGKSEDGSTYTGAHAVVGTDAFSIHDKSHNTLASFDASGTHLLKGALDFAAHSETISGKAYEYGGIEGTSGIKSLNMSIGQTTSPIQSASVSVMRGPSLATANNPTAQLQAQYNGGTSAKTHQASIGVNASASSAMVELSCDSLIVGGSTVPLACVAARLQPLVWRWAEKAIGDTASYSATPSSYWTTLGGVMSKKITGPSNHTPYYTCSDYYLKTAIAGYWRLKVAVCLSTSGRAMAAITIGGVNQAEGAEQSGGGYVSATTETVLYAEKGVEIDFRFASEQGYYTKLNGAHCTWVEIEYLGDK